jgi:hypothetical protein
MVETISDTLVRFSRMNGNFALAGEIPMRAALGRFDMLLGVNCNRISQNKKEQDLSCSFLLILFII